MGIDKKYLVTYSETVTYEKIVTGETEAEAKKEFQDMLDDQALEPKSVDVIEYVLEEE